MDFTPSERSKHWKFYKDNSKIEWCFAKGIGKCCAEIAESHSLQKNGILSQLEDETKGGNRIYALDSWLYDEKGNIKEFKLVGKGGASVFTGFCSDHDVKLFAPIEQQPLVLSEQQIFLFYYRGFAHSHHQLAELTKFKKRLSPVLGDHSPFYEEGEWKKIVAEFKHETEVFNIRYLNSLGFKRRLNYMLALKDYSLLDSYYMEISYTRIASSQVLVLPFTYFGESLKRWESLTYVVLTIIPDKVRTIVLFSHFKDDIKGAAFVTELKALSQVDFLQAVSSILTYSGANTYFAPEVLDKLVKEERIQLIKEIEYLTFLGHNHGGFFHSKINFFA